MAVLVLVIAGLYLGSFVNVLVSRLPQPKRSPPAPPGDVPPALPRGSVLWGRSMCPCCRHALAAWDMVPVVSWVVLRGRCRHCHRPIDDGPLVELAVPALFVVSYLSWPATLDGLGVVPFTLWLVLGAGAIGLVAHRLRRRRRSA
jgi:leader peptidase (prepilin peptidase)/N-methyltransferase